ncbi:hypothetical protein AB0F93_03680 [Micromonospora tulbaghiae]|uniref:hypothetical protein n=1 Tax=Micromonospora tulbaghiae TaxID=479978 RepID=UPI00331939D4
MPQLPALAPTSNCPSLACRAPVGQPHTEECETAVCLPTGEQRILHRGDRLADLLDHDCGQDTWTGQHYGIAECQEYGWYVRRATSSDPDGAAWVPCEPNHPNAVPDLDRLARHGVWHPADRRWYRRAEGAARG